MGTGFQLLRQVGGPRARRQGQGPSGRRELARDRPQQARLAAAVGADDPEPLTRLDLEGQRREHLRGAVHQGQVFDAEQRHATKVYGGIAASQPETAPGRDPEVDGRAVRRRGSVVHRASGLTTRFRHRALRQQSDYRGVAAFSSLAPARQYHSAVPNAADLMLRLVIALVLGAVVGLERERQERAAGLRTVTMVSLGSCLFTIVGAYGFSQTDPSRVAAQIVTGIGFLGAGTI